ncbi:hypothetical protein [Paenibacillus koleovorans]|uniref:hypothetical protein n=1 Tax=Paenibacillus koleovorans TaxID=121608 RepID=UPI000FD906BF|nr:hypothetical protein [Paenibacillus koleovorans]
MPFVARHRESGQVWTGMLVNSYKLPYYGTKYWDFEEDATAGLPVFLEEQGADTPEAWQLMEVEEAQLKRYNVKLKNSPLLLLYTDEAGTADIRKRE